MASMLTSIFSRDPKANFPYELPNESFHSDDGVHLGKCSKKGGGNELAVCFWSSSLSAVLKIQAQKLKTLRHPNMLTYFDSLETEGSFYLVTEFCRPLTLYFKETKFTASQKELVVSWGLYQILNGLKFLHNDVKLSHENIRRSIFVTEAGDWKLAGFSSTNDFRSPKKDLNSLGILIWEIFNGFRDGDFNKPEPPGKMPKSLHSLYKKMVTAQAAKLTAEGILKEYGSSGGFLKNKFVDTLLFLEEFQLKETKEKQAFFAHLNDNLDVFPDDVSKYKILPKLIETYEYGDAGSNVLTPLFKLGALLDEDEYQSRIVPCLVKLFGSPDRITRVKLLEKMDQIAPHLSAVIVNEKIYTNLATGFLDTNPAVRESTVKAMVSISEKLNNYNLNTDLMKYLARLQGGDDQAGIRTNATICLGKIAEYLDCNQRSRILVSAFGRAVRDPFPPSRIAAILALSATQHFYSLSDIATKILPSIAPLTCDPEKQVRDQAFKALRGFVEKLEKASENPELIPELEARVRAGRSNALIDSDKVPQWASWALKALSGKFYRGNTPTTADTQQISTAEGEKGESISGQNRGGKGEAISGQNRDVDRLEEKQRRVSDGQLLDEGNGWTEMDSDQRAESSEDEADWSHQWLAKPCERKYDSSQKKESSGRTEGLNLAKKASHVVKKSTKEEEEEEDINTLLGIGPAETGVQQNYSKWKTEGGFSNVRGEREKNDGWDSFIADDDDNSNEDWTEDWSTGAIPEASRKGQNRKAELAARNERRKREMEARKRQQKSGAPKAGAMKLTSFKTSIFDELT